MQPLRSPCLAPALHGRLSVRCSQLAELLLLARGAVLQLDHRIRRRGLAYKRVLPLRPLATFDKEGRATLLELNTGGGL